MRNRLSKSVIWFNNLLIESKRTGKAKVKTLRGKLLFMVYDPKTKAKLPYYDTHPLIFVLEVRPTYILGINVHYLDYKNRERLVAALYKFGIDDTDDEAKLKFRYNDVADFIEDKRVLVCFKMYYTKLIKNWLIIPTGEWDNVLTMPLQQFQKKTTAYVWKESRKKI